MKLFYKTLGALTLIPLFAGLTSCDERSSMEYFNTSLTNTCPPFSDPTVNPEFSLKYVGKDAYLGIYYSNPENPRLVINADEVWNIIDKAGIPEVYHQQFWNAVLFHERCVHTYESFKEIMFDTPIPIPHNNSLYGYEIIGLRGSTLLTNMVVEDEEGNEVVEIQELHQLSELFAAYYMWDNIYVPDAEKILEIGGKEIPHVGRYQIGLGVNNHINMKEAFDLFHNQDEESILKAWNIMLLGHDPWDIDEEGNPIVFRFFATIDMPGIDMQIYKASEYNIASYMWNYYSSGADPSIPFYGKSIEEFKK